MFRPHARQACRAVGILRYSTRVNCGERFARIGCVGNAGGSVFCRITHAVMKVSAANKSKLIGIDAAGALRYLKAASERIANVAPGRLLQRLLSIELERREFICR